MLRLSLTACNDNIVELTRCCLGVANRWLYKNVEIIKEHGSHGWGGGSFIWRKRRALAPIQPYQQSSRPQPHLKPAILRNRRVPGF